ncbi:hypothetical protein GCM10023238_19190 [Streptomyces heliomycini]
MGPFPAVGDGPPVVSAGRYRACGTSRSGPRGSSSRSRVRSSRRSSDKGPGATRGGTPRTVSPGGTGGS